MTQFAIRTCVFGAILSVAFQSTVDQASAETKISRASRTRQKLSPQQQQNLDQLKIDLQAIQSKSQFTKEQKQAIAKDLTTILSVANKPSQESVQTLADDLTKFLADGKLGTAEALTLTKDVAAVLSTANISQEDAQQLKADVQTALKASNLTQADVKTLQQDVQAIVKAVQDKQKTAK